MYQIAIQTKSIIKEMNEMEENEKMKVYVVLCNGRLSSEGYETLKQAQRFCESRGATKKENGNGWLYEDNCHLYQITDVQVRKGNK